MHKPECVKENEVDKIWDFDKQMDKPIEARRFDKSLTRRKKLVI